MNILSDQWSFLSTRINFLISLKIVCKLQHFYSFSQYKSRKKSCGALVRRPTKEKKYCRSGCKNYIKIHARLFLYFRLNTWKIDFSVDKYTTFNYFCLFIRYSLADNTFWSELLRMTNSDVFTFTPFWSTIRDQSIHPSQHFFPEHNDCKILRHEFARRCKL